MRVPDTAHAHKVCAALLPSTFVTTRGRRAEDGTNGPGGLGHLLVDTADRLRRLPESRLNKVATSARGLAQTLADAAAGIEGRDAATAPPIRAIPTLSIFALADQVAVTAQDLRAGTAELDPATPVWWEGARTPLQDVLTALRAEAERVRART